MAFGFLLSVLVQASLLLLIFCLGIEATAVANFSNEACTTGGVKPSEPLLFTCGVNVVVVLRVVLPTGDQEIISVGDTAADVALPAGFTAVALDITEIDETTRNFTLTLFIDSASLLNGGEIKCDDTSSSNEAKAKCPVIIAVANFSNEACTTGGVKPSEPLLFTCEVYGAVLLRVVLPTGDQEIMSVGETAADVALPTGFTAVSLNITEINESTRNFKLTLSIDSASLLNGGEITCDDTTSRKSAMAGCPIAQLTLSFINDTPRVSEYSMIADFTANREGVEIICYIPGLGKESINCSSGTFSHDFTIDQIWERNTNTFFLHIETTDPNTNERVTLIGAFRVFGHQEKYFCTQNMINTATRPIQQGGFVEFITVGKAANFTCEIDERIDGSIHTIPCGNNVRNITALGMERKIYNLTIPSLTPGPHRLVVQPTGGCKYSVCYRPMTYLFTVAD